MVCPLHGCHRIVRGRMGVRKVALRRQSRSAKRRAIWTDERRSAIRLDEEDVRLAKELGLLALVCLMLGFVPATAVGFVLARLS